MHRLFPSDLYEAPNDVVFELTGVLHVVPATLATWRLLGPPGITMRDGVGASFDNDPVRSTS